VQVGFRNTHGCAQTASCFKIRKLPILPTDCVYGFNMIIRIDDYCAKQYCHVFKSVYVTYRRVLDWVIGFIDTLYTRLGTQAVTALSLIYTLYSPPLHARTHTHTHALGFSVVTSHNLATDFNTGTITVSLNHTLRISLYYRTPKDFLYCRTFSSQLSCLDSSITCALPTLEL
jgi:hypothetical protein